MTPPPSMRDVLVRAPGLWRDVLRAFGLLIAVAVVFVLPPALLPWHIYRWVMISVAVVGVWFVLFLWVRTGRAHRRMDAEAAAQQARWQQERAVREAEQAARRREPD